MVPDFNTSHLQNSMLGFCKTELAIYLFKLPSYIAKLLNWLGPSLLKNKRHDNLLGLKPLVPEQTHPGIYTVVILGPWNFNAE